jgi:hypothetical protein
MHKVLKFNLEGLYQHSQIPVKGIFEHVPNRELSPEKKTFQVSL